MKHYAIQFLLWLSKSFGDKGDVSSRRLSAFQVMLVYTYARISYIRYVADATMQLYGFLTDAVFILLLFGIVTAQQIVEFIKGKDKKTDA